MSEKPLNREPIAKAAVEHLIYQVRNGLDFDRGVMLHALNQALVSLEPQGLPEGCYRAHPHENMPPHCEIQAERLRQIHEEGLDAAHDDAHTTGEMADAAACYAATGPIFGEAWLDRSPMEDRGDTPAPRLIQHSVWPWDEKWWKPKDRRRNLIKAGALILAEIERLDRQALAPAKGSEHG